MFLLRTLALWSLLVFLSASSGARTAGQQKSVNRRGSFRREEMQCTWAATDVGETVKLSVRCENPAARRTGGVTELECDYDGQPALCAGYRSDPKTFWKQVGRAFKRMPDKVCYDDRAQVKAKMCKAQRHAHFKLDIMSSRGSAQSGDWVETPPPTPAPPPGERSSTGKPQLACTENEELRKVAERCSRSFFCSTIMNLLQSAPKNCTARADAPTQGI